MKPEQMYKLGYYVLRWNGSRWVMTGDTVVCDNLYPMTHKEACTMKSKQGDPNNWFLVPVDSTI